MDIVLWSELWLGLMLELVAQPFLVNNVGEQFVLDVLLAGILTLIIGHRKQVHGRQWWLLLIGTIINWLLLLPFGGFGTTSTIEQLYSLSTVALHVLYVHRRFVITVMVLLYLLCAGLWLRFGCAWLLTQLRHQSSHGRSRRAQTIALLLTIICWCLLTITERHLPDTLAAIFWLAYGSLAISYWWSFIITYFWQLPSANSFRVRVWPVPLICCLLSLLLAGVVLTHQNRLYANNRPIVVAHRGNDGNNGVPNTLQSLRKTARYHPQYVETDIQRTRDGHFITLHDASLWKMTGHRGIASQMNMKQLAATRVSYHGWHTTLTPFRQYYSFAYAHHVPLIVEIKPQRLSKRQTVHKFHELYPDKYLPHYLIHTVDPLIAKQVSTQMPQIKLGMITPFIVSRLPEWYQFYSTDYRTINPVIVNQLHRHHKKVFAWTVDSPAIAIRLKQMGIDGIITNNYSRMYAIINNDDYFLFIQVKGMLLGLL